MRVMVLGGGVIGTASAYYLARAGFDVVVQYTTPDWLRVGIVSGEVPGGGSKQPKGSTITLFVT